MAETLGMIVGTSLFVSFIVYVIGIWWYSRIYFIRRHGVHFTGSDDGTVGAICVGIIWPIVVFFMPSVKYPQLCEHRHHILARHEVQQQLQREEEAIQETLQRERGVGY